MMKGEGSHQASSGVIEAIRWDGRPNASRDADRPQSQKYNAMPVEYWVLAVKLERTDTTLDLSHIGKESWRGKKRGGYAEEDAVFILETALQTQRVTQRLSRQQYDRRHHSLS
jgi:hypothetical protein